jgi:NAD(P)-dependent dehydrogenase (short-subunit alcohol dehydrogenase family)
MMPQILARHPIGRIGQAEEVANAVAWLCSQAASITTGHTFPIGGGLFVPQAAALPASQLHSADV